jgi:hypothetical protein
MTSVEPTDSRRDWSHRHTATMRAPSYFARGVSVAPLGRGLCEAGGLTQRAA